MKNQHKYETTTSVVHIKQLMELNKSRTIFEQPLLPNQAFKRSTSAGMNAHTLSISNPGNLPLTIQFESVIDFLPLIRVKAPPSHCVI